MIDELQRLQQWYIEQCDGDWEHSYGISIGTLDNPGWTLRIDLAGTRYSGRPPGTVEVSNDGSEDHWISCQIKDDQFFAAGGPATLSKLISRFFEWLESN